MARRKRIPYDPPHARKGKKGRRASSPSRADQVFLSRRMLLAKGVVAAAFATLAVRLGFMQLVEGERWQKAAANNIRRGESWSRAPRSCSKRRSA